MKKRTIHKRTLRNVTLLIGIGLSVFWPVNHKLNVAIAPEKENATIIEELTVQDDLHQEIEIMADKIEERLEFPQTSALGSNALILGTHVMPFEEGGMEKGKQIIDKNPDTIASTYGGTTIFSGDDQKNTHFIGHNVGAFTPFLNIPIDTPLIVVDCNGKETTYYLQKVITCTIAAKEFGTNLDYYDYIVEEGNQERVTIQTCVDSVPNLNIYFFALKGEKLNIGGVGGE
jgi:hypothetical protein